MGGKGWLRKKVLSLVLCVAVMLSVMVVGAGAAFSDQSKIKNTEAVDACVALNIIGGYPDGSYRPEGNITRAEVCKMICVALNGGKDPNVTSAANPTFTDVRTDPNSAWAEGYIESCVAQGIVGGIGGGKFAPSQNVTGSQLAKMLLVSLGYKSENENFGGPNWDTFVNMRASQKGLYEGLEKLDTSAALTRDSAAQMVWNALNAYEVEYVTTLVTENGQLTTQVTVQDKVVGSNNDKITLMEDKYEADTFTGTFDGDSNVVSVKDGQIQVTGTSDADKDKTATFTYDFNLKYIGEEVKVLFKDGTGGKANVPDDKDTIYGVYVTGGTSVVNATLDDIDDNYGTAGKVSVADQAYKVADSGSIIKNYDDVQKTTWNAKNAGVTAIEKLSATNGNTVKFILNDSNEITTAYVTEYNITKVTAVNSSKVSLSGVGSVDIEDNEIYQGIAKDDVVVYQKLYSTTTSDATFIITKADSVSGKLTGFKGTEKVTIDGTTYSTMNKTLAKNLTDDYKVTLATGDINESITAYLVNGFVACVDMAESASNYALIESVGNGTIGGVDEFKIKVILADGTEKTVVVDEDSDAKTKDDYKEDTLIKYASISDSNVMDVSKIIKPDTASKYYDKDTKTFDGKVTTTDAVLFVKVADNGSTNYYAYNIRSLGNITTASNAKYVLNSDNKVEAAYVELGAKPSGATSDTVYGIVTAANGTVKVGDEYKSEYKVANDKNEYTVYMQTSSTVAKGDIVSFDLASDNIYSNSDVTVYNATDAKYIDELDKDNVLSYYDSIGGTLETKALDDDAQIVYVNQDSDKAGTDIGVGEYDSIDQYANAVVVLDSNGTKIVAIIVESSGECNVINGMSTKATVEVKDDAAVKALDDGVYTPSEDFTTNNMAGKPADNRIFKFTTTEANQNCTLSVKDSSGTEVYSESYTFDKGNHYFFITLNPVGQNAGTEKGSWTGAAVTAAPAGAYSFTVVAGSITLLSGTFTA